jgi:hypothetical protein
MQEQITKDQHIVPRAYLRRFSDPETKQLQVFDKHLEKFTPPKHVKALAKEPFWYAEKTGVQDELSQLVEEYMQPFEQMIGSKEYDELIERIMDPSQPVSYEDNMAVSLVAAHLHLRGRGFRASLEDFDRQMQEGISRIVPNAQQYPNLAPYFDRDNRMHIKFLTGEVRGFFNTFTHMKKRYLYRTEEPLFLTSDTPVGQFMPPDHKPGFWGIGLAGWVYTLSLSPHLHVELHPPHKIAGKHTSRRRAEGNRYKMINAHVYKSAEQYVYGRSKSDFKSLFKSS